jgi:hypothetical protein
MGHDSWYLTAQVLNIDNGKKYIHTIGQDQCIKGGSYLATCPPGSALSVKSL